MLSQTLKEATRDVHAALEKQLVNQIRAIDSKESYGRLLTTMYGYYHPIEQQLSAMLNESDIPDLSKRRKSSWIVNDLRNLSIPTDRLPMCDDVPAISNVATALGVSYVLEGSTLGGKVISDLLTKQTSGTLGDALSFFQGYRENTMPMWQSFRQRLDLVPEEDHAKTIDSATQTFTKFNQWIKRYDVIEL